MTLTPKKLKTGIGSTVILSCTLMGSPEFTIRWYRNTELVLPGEAISIRGLSNETLLITSAQKSHSGAYQCFASRKAQTAQDFAIIVLEGELGLPGGARTPTARPGHALPPAPSCPPDRSHSSSACYMPGSSSQGPGVKIIFNMTYFAVEETEALVICPRPHSSAKELGLNSGLLTIILYCSPKLLERHS